MACENRSFLSVKGLGESRGQLIRYIEKFVGSDDGTVAPSCELQRGLEWEVVGPLEEGMDEIKISFYVFQQCVKWATSPRGFHDRRSGDAGDILKFIMGMGFQREDIQIRIGFLPMDIVFENVVSRAMKTPSLMVKAIDQS